MCPACRCSHRFDVGRWTFNGDMDRPTFTPSMHVTTGPTPKRHPRFPILTFGRNKIVDIPWELLLPHAEQAIANHGGQTLERLAERGGLCYSEAVAILTDQPWPHGKVEGSEEKLGVLIRAWYDAQPNSICHSFVTDGNIQFLSDCTHSLAGQTVPLKPF